MSQGSLIQFFSVNPLSAPAQAAQSICHQLHSLTMSLFYCTPVSIPKPVPCVQPRVSCAVFMVFPGPTVHMSYFRGLDWTNLIRRNIAGLEIFGGLRLVGGIFWVCLLDFFKFLDWFIFSWAPLLLRTSVIKDGPFLHFSVIFEKPLLRSVAIPRLQEYINFHSSQVHSSHSTRSESSLGMSCCLYFKFVLHKMFALN